MTSLAQRHGIELDDSQREQRNAAAIIGDYSVDTRLLETGEKFSRYEARSLTISDEDAYEVLSVCSVGNALYLMTKGVRSPLEARKFLLKRRASDLKIDNSDLAAEMLRRRIPFRNFLRRYAECHRLNAHPVNLADGIEYRDIYGFRHVGDSVMLPRVLDGSLSLPLLKELGVEVASDYVGHLQEILEAYTSGQTSASLDDIRVVVHRCKTETSYSLDAKSVLSVLQYVSYSEWGHIERLSGIAYQYQSLKSIADQATRARYAVTTALSSEETGYRMSNTEGISVLESGVDYKEANVLIKNGATVQQAIAVVQGRTSSAVASGWL